MAHFFFFAVGLRVVFFAFRLAGFLFFAIVARVSAGNALNRDVSAWLPFSLGNMMLWYILYMVKANSVSGSDLSSSG